MVLASERAKFGHPEILLGCFPPAAGPLLRRIVGRHKTAEIIASGETFDAAEALATGLVNRVYDEDAFPGACAEYARRLCEKSGAVLRLAKRSYADLDREEIFAEIDRNEKLYLDELVREPDMLEGIEAFLEKRAPAWREGTS
ncbi:MAG: cyclohexa-1,5-dienecarbonyl-CoA hydratase, partial [Gemmatimonadetes bacterium]|nr:cyclohexa-1,5-dienecarbonyl-CoA hydratase [Gemmatimonadota bacterium]